MKTQRMKRALVRTVLKNTRMQHGNLLQELHLLKGMADVGIRSCMRYPATKFW
jgi:hypothetical protein